MNEIGCALEQFCPGCRRINKKAFIVVGYDELVSLIYASYKYEEEVRDKTQRNKTLL